MRGEDGGRGDAQRPQLLDLALQPPVLLRQRAEAALQVLALHLRLLQLRPACRVCTKTATFYIRHSPSCLNSMKILFDRYTKRSRKFRIFDRSVGT